jgi:uncharacterized membrane protein
VRALFESFRDSLFFLPALFVVAAVGAAEGMLALDARVSLDTVPSFFRFTVDSARELLSAVAGGAITVTGIVFALTALSVQLASSQFSPRVVRGFLRDRFNQAAIGFMSATFTYSLVVLRAVRTPDAEGSSVVPNLSAGLALILAVMMILVILAYVNHTAQSLQATHLIGNVTEGAVALVAKRFPDLGDGEDQPPSSIGPATGGHRVSAPHSGWVQQVSEADLLDALPPGGLVRVELRVGSFVHAGRRLSTVWINEPADTETLHRLDEEIHDAFAIGGTRTMQQDVAFGIRQLVDVALRALSTGVNDATTAYECIVQLGEVLFEILRRDLPPAVRHGDDGRCVLRPHELTHADYVGRAFDQIRRNAAPMPDLCLALVRTLGSLAAELDDLGLGDRVAALARQARLVVAGATAEDPLPEDLDLVRQAVLDAGFGPLPPAGPVAS